MINQDPTSGHTFEMTVNTLVRLRSETSDAIAILAKIVKEGMLQRGNYEIGVLPTPGLDDTLVRIVHPRNMLRASIDMQGRMNVLEVGGGETVFEISQFDDALDHLFQQIVQRA